MATDPGFAFAAASTSRKSLKGCATCVTIAIGEVPMSITFARSFVVLKERFGITEGFTPCVSNTTPKVVPSGAAWATAAAPIEPEAPVRFSTMNCWPSCVVSWAASTRATWSVEPPGGKPTTNFTVLVGQAWAWAKGAASATARAAATVARVRKLRMGPLGMGCGMRGDGTVSEGEAHDVLALAHLAGGLEAEAAVEGLGAALPRHERKQHRLRP